MAAMVHVHYKEGAEKVTGTVSRLMIVDAPGFDRENYTTEQLDVLATCAWVLCQNEWELIFEITWRDNANNIVWPLPNPMVKRAETSAEQLLREGRF